MWLQSTHCAFCLEVARPCDRKRRISVLSPCRANSTVSGVCRPTSSRRSTASRRRRARAARTSSISAWAIPTCRRPITSSTSWSRPPAIRAPTAIPPRAASRGCAGRMAAYYQRRFGVTLDPDSEVIATLGSKEGFANLAQAITAPGDVVLVPNPAYPIHAYRLHHGGRRDPPRAGDFAGRISVAGSAAPCAIPCRRRWRWWSIIRRTPPRRSSAWISTKRS